ncbi:hypothetical protein [Anderseniella sp. Alg231-50]|uniref:hypothetical protein n=1 Tax=Anderseniella sp. Alg231-50 TaxID=1922226 RepID=UPI00307B2536
MIDDRTENAVAWMAYNTYLYGIWPLGAVLSGMLGEGMVWSAIGAAPLVLITFLDDRRTQKLSDDPRSITNSLVVVLLLFVSLTLSLYFLGRLFGWLLSE